MKVVALCSTLTAIVLARPQLDAAAKSASLTLLPAHDSTLPVDALLNDNGNAAEASKEAPHACEHGLNHETMALGDPGFDVHYKGDAMLQAACAPNAT